MAGRPREFDREAALIKARNLFWQHGFDGTSLADLVDELGIASARIYKAFGSKEALFREAVEHYEDHEGRFGAQALAEPDLRTAIRTLLISAIALYTGQQQPGGCMVVSSGHALSEEHHQLQQWLEAKRVSRTQQIVARFQQAVTCGELSQSGDAVALGQFYATVLHGLSVQARDGATPETLHPVVDLALMLLPK